MPTPETLGSTKPLPPAGAADRAAIEKPVSVLSRLIESMEAQNRMLSAEIQLLTSLAERLGMELPAYPEAATPDTPEPPGAVDRMAQLLAYHADLLNRLSALGEVLNRLA